jgi:deoxyribodipyrimidine photolyase-related protein
MSFAPDDITRDVFASIRRILPDLPGDAESFAWPVTREQALAALNDFVACRLAQFGPFEDAMWTGEPTLYHSTLSSALNLKLLNPRECCERAIAAYHAGGVPLQSVEAFVRQIIGWREFIRGVYWLEGPAYADRNGLDQHGELPTFYWTADTDMACMKSCLGQVINTGFGHHIQRLMVTGNFALISGVHPRAVSDWYLGMFIDGIDWVTLPNALGMVMHADRRPSSAKGTTGLVGTKPYAASGKYIQRMSNYCSRCRYDPAERSGPAACPFTLFYWDFLIRTRDTLADNQRMSMILKHVDRMTPEARTQITIDADLLRKKLGIAPHSASPSR